ncbi:MAG: carbohydrate ABC transporter permease [Lachnospiraceae bacterium]|nr:carbohydrate ABC transporter permease [Lachnospiraceae bacterium]
MQKLKASTIKKAIIYIVLILGTFIMLMPFLWMILTSFKTYKETIAVPITWFPEKWLLENYTEVLMKLDFIRYYGNTILVTVFTVFFMMFFSAMGAYAFARMNFPFKNVIFALLLTTFMVPPQLTMIPKYLIISQLKWVDTLAGIVVPNIFSVYSMFLLRQFFAGLPRELEDAAKIDGCSYFRLFWNISLPLCKSGMVAMMVLNVLWAWNDLLWPLIATSTDKLRVLSVGMATLQGQHGTDYPLLMAAGVMAVIPMLIIYTIGQKYFIEGIAFTGVKG